MSTDTLNICGAAVCWLDSFRSYTSTVVPNILLLAHIEQDIEYHLLT